MARSGHPRTVVLVVEDEPLLRMDTVDMVEEAGFEAVEAANAAQAMHVLEDRDDVRIILSDVDMPPGLDGMELAALVRNRWPPIEIILVSGHISSDRVRLPERGVFFSKPYRPRDLVTAMRQMAA